MKTDAKALGVRRLYGERVINGRVVLKFADREVELSAQGAEGLSDIENRLYTKLREGVRSAPCAAVDALLDAGVLYEQIRASMPLTGSEFYSKHFARIQHRWIERAFSHPFWGRMDAGRGSARLFAGWLFELYHYTKNAHRHMPLAAAYATEKHARMELSKHFAEEWNHYHYFERALMALGFSADDVMDSRPLPMTQAMSNFMRQAARTGTLAYAICSAILEGTTEDVPTYSSFYVRVQELYGIPADAIGPIFEHLDLDKKYGHLNLFELLCANFPSITAADASVVLTHGYQMVEHIWAWTDNIERYYSADDAEVPRRLFSSFDY
jgi:hypothetical protein